MEALKWFDRKFSFGLPVSMLPFYLERLAGTLSRCRNKISGVTDEQLRAPFEGKWSVKQQFGHLMECEAVSITRINEISSGVEIISPAAYDPQDYSDRGIDDLLDEYDEKRKERIRLTRSIPIEVFEKQSIHPRLKVAVSIVDLAYFDAEHDDHHLYAVSRILGMV